MTETLLNYFRAKQQVQETERVYPSQCPFCSMQCKLQIREQVTGYRRKVIVSGLDNPTTNGRVCVKGLHAHQHALHSKRLLHPLIKRNGQFQQATWDEALALISERFRVIQQEYGRDAVAVYGSASLTNEEAYVLGKFARVALQTRYIDYNGRLCMSAAATAANQTFGVDRGFTFPLTDIPYTRVLLLVGTNLAECQPTMMSYVEKAKQNGAYIIVVDPRETQTAKLADLHLQLKPGTDAALANGLLKVIVSEQRTDDVFLQNRVNGWEEVRAYLDTLDLNKIAEITGITAEAMTKAARVFATEETAMILTARGVEQQTDGAMTVRNLLNLLLVTGKVGKFACGYGAITGQGNGQGAREHGQKADQLPGYRSIENAEDREWIAKVWNLPEREIPRKGVSAVQMFEKMAAGEIKSLFLMCSNPVVSLPNSTAVKAAIRQLSFFVAVDLFLSETAELADVVLPATSFLEDEGTMTNVEGRVTIREARYPRKGEAKHDWEIICALAKGLGKAEFFPYTCAEDIFTELRRASEGGRADYAGMSYERIRATGGLHWPCPTESHAGTDRLFVERFAHRDGLARMVVVKNEAVVAKDSVREDFPLLLTTGRVMAHYLTGVQTRRSAGLAARNIESFVEIHPMTARKYEVQEGELVKISSPHGEMVVRCVLTEAVRPDTLFVPMHWSGGQNVNALTGQSLDPDCQMPGFKLVAVRVCRTDRG